jgi:quinol monooxygenase YgiN
VTRLQAVPNVAPTQIHHGQGLLPGLQARALRGGGSVVFTVLDEIERANRFVRFELWTDAQAYQDFERAARTQASIDRIEAILRRRWTSGPATRSASGRETDLWKRTEPASVERVTEERTP